VTTHDHDHEHHDHAPGFVARWLFSTNHKDIGTLYLLFAVVAGCVGGALSIIMRAQLQHPHGTIVTSGQEWNTIITSHGLIMIFFTAEQHQLLAAAAGLRADHDRPDPGRVWHRLDAVSPAVAVHV
jgi:heme/copper-type cytochrome/quinol oxidase subunit 1